MDFSAVRDKRHEPCARKADIAPPALSLRERRPGVASLLVPITFFRPSPVAQEATTYDITDWISIASTGEVTLGLSQPEVGQGSYTVLPQILADELDADWQRVNVRFVTGKDAYNIAFKNEAPAQKEGASMSTTTFYERLRIAGAAAREALTARRGRDMGIAVAQCRTEKGFVINASGGRLSYGELAPAAARLPLNDRPRLKQPGAARVDRQADATTGFAGQVDRQRALRHRCHRPRHAQCARSGWRLPSPAR